jgi:futalosine hydrolase
MSFNILYVTATMQEADILRKIEKIVPVQDKFRSGRFEIDSLVTGVGSMSTAWSMTQWISANEKPVIAINAGIAGSYDNALPAGSVVMPVSDCFADAGIEDGDNFLTLHETGLSNPDEFPFTNGIILAENKYTEIMKGILKPVKAITVNTATGSEATKWRLYNKFNPDIETMEGAAFFYICARERIPFISLRAISNRVERRDRDRWNIPLALENLAFKLEEVLKILEE